MKIFSTLSEIHETFPVPIVTMGNFDGVHFGHQHLFRQIQKRARKLKGTSMVITFDPHPQKILFPDREFYLINHIEEKIDIIKHIGIDVLLCMAFTRQFSASEPEDFVRDVLVNTLHVREIYVGNDSRFGYGQKGSPEALQRWGTIYGFEVKRVPLLTRDGGIVSSTRIRALIRQGRVEEAAHLLDRPYALDGIIVTGTHRGSTLLGYPTANLEVLHELVPKNGVYICRVIWQERLFPAVVNVGTNPTFDHQETTVEAHLLDFHGNLYGEQMKIIFLQRIRDEMTFSNSQALATQIGKDVLVAKAYFTNHPS